MKLTCLWALLGGLSLSACKHNDSAQPATNELAGNWSGTYNTKQAGNCTWGGDASIIATAIWQVTDTIITGTLNRQYGQVSSPTQLTGIISGSKVQLSETKANNVICYGTSRTYFSRYEGTINGNTLSLVSMDTLCPVQGCIFQHTVNLTRQ